MPARSVGIAVVAVLLYGVSALLPFAARADTYGAGTYGNDIYNGSGTGTSTTSTTTTSSGGGTCTNCGSTSVSSNTSSPTTHSSGSSTNTSTVSATTTAPYVCASSMAGGDLPLAQLINLFVSLGIIPQEKAQKACSAVTTSQGTTTVPMQTQFTKPLKLGSRDAEVHLLQVFLNTHGFAVAVNGPGSSGNETDLYGILTKQAVARFQAAYTAEILTPVGLTAPSGFFGPSSMKKANALLGSK